MSVPVLTTPTATKSNIIGGRESLFNPILRLQELCKLERGWRDGAGEPIDRDALGWLIDFFDGDFIDFCIDNPGLSPTEDGDISAYWEINGTHVFLDIAIHEKTGECMFLDGTGTEWVDVDFTDKTSVSSLFHKIKALYD